MSLESIDRIIGEYAPQCQFCGTHSLFSKYSKEVKITHYDRLRDRVWAFLTREEPLRMEVDVETTYCVNGHIIGEYEIYAFNRSEPLWWNSYSNDLIDEETVLEEFADDLEWINEIHKEFLEGSKSS